MWIELSMHRNLFFLTQELEPRPAWDSNIRGLNLQTEKHFIKIRWCWLGWIHTSSDCQTDTEMKGASWIYLFIYCICEFLPSFVQYLAFYLLLFDFVLLSYCIIHLQYLITICFLFVLSNGRKRRQVIALVELNYLTSPMCKLMARQ